MAKTHSVHDLDEVNLASGFVFGEELGGSFMSERKGEERSSKEGNLVGTWFLFPQVLGDGV